MKNAILAKEHSKMKRTSVNDTQVSENFLLMTKQG